MSSDVISTSDVIEYQSGSAVMLTQIYTDNSGVATDPMGVVLRVRDPSSIITVPTVDHDEIGVYTSTFLVVEAGFWVYEWKTTGGNAVNIGEFSVLPSPMDDPLQGAIARRARSMVPATWDALANASYYGVAMLNTRISVAKNMAVGPVLALQDEAIFTTLMQEYIATLVAIEIIPAGIEYWMQQKLSISSTGTNETASFTDRQLAFLRGILPQLQAKRAALAANADVVASIPGVGDGPAVSGNDDDQLITNNPYDFLPAFSDVTGTVTGAGGE